MIAIITTEQKDLLHGKEFAPDIYYNCIQDAYDEWVISAEEIRDTTNPEFLWVKDLPLSEYYKKPNT